MLLRLIVGNLFSFKEQTEFNMFTNKSQRLLHHKKHIGDISFLNMAALYGANGAGKSNLIKVLTLLVKFISNGEIYSRADEMKFKLDSAYQNEPMSVGVEFVANEQIYFYTISFDETGVLYEYLSLSGKNNDKRIFERSFEKGKENIQFHDGYSDDLKNRLFVEMLSEKFVGRRNLLLSLLNGKYASDFPEVPIAYHWFTDTLVVVQADAKTLLPISLILDRDEQAMNYANELIGKLSTGVNRLSVNKYELQRSEHTAYIFDQFDKNTHTMTEMSNRFTGEITNYTKDGDKIIARSVNAQHADEKGQAIEFGLGIESDGTRRLIDFIPMLYGIIHEQHVYVVDEIERSIHPMVIKELITLISKNQDMNGQIIFSTHESCLLDQNILRTDEIWFAQKDQQGATQLYSLSDYNVHATANIENGYLNGRYGGIPFLNDMSELHWEDEQK